MTAPTFPTWPWCWRRCWLSRPSCCAGPSDRNGGSSSLAGLAEHQISIWCSQLPSLLCDVGLIDLPAVADGMPVRPGNLGQQRREPLHPAVDSDVKDFDTALSEQFLDVAIGQAKRRYQRTVTTITGREAEASEGGPQDQGSTRAAPGRRVLMPAVWVLERGHGECNS